MRLVSLARPPKGRQLFQMVAMGIDSGNKVGRPSDQLHRAEEGKRRFSAAKDLPCGFVQWVFSASLGKAARDWDGEVGTGWAVALGGTISAQARSIRCACVCARVCVYPPMYAFVQISTVLNATG